jgi:hypothetical protein|tara:strand:- start:818 stop:1183 length:366 start_codon:yes stop_codon:yes gene_type:complete
MNKAELIQYLNANTVRKSVGRKEIKLNDIFISSSSNTSNFRLTMVGRDIMRKQFDQYQIVLHSEYKTETGTQIIQLDRYMNSPYYLKNSKLIIFEESIAAEFVLIGNDFDLWIKNKEYMTN